MPFDVIFGYIFNGITITHVYFRAITLAVSLPSGLGFKQLARATANIDA